MGCIPTKALVRSAEAIHTARRGAELGFRAEVEVDFPRIRERKNKLVAGVRRGIERGFEENPRIELIRGWLRGRRYVDVDDAFQTERSLAAGHVNAVLAMARKLGLARLLDRSPSRQRDLALALVCQRVLCPESKLATSRALSRLTLACELGVEGADQDDLYAAMDWLLERQARIEDQLARRHQAVRASVGRRGERVEGSVAAATGERAQGERDGQEYASSQASPPCSFEGRARAHSDL